MIGFDRDAYAKNPAHIESVQGYLYHQDLPSHRMFQWRMLRAYRLFANEKDQSLRQLCGQSPQPPTLSDANGLIRIELTHAGTNQSSAEEIPPRTPVILDVDPAHGYLIRRHETILEREGGEANFTQQFEVQAFREFPGKLFLPTKVSVSAKVGNNALNQEMEFEYPNVNRPVDTNRRMFVENVIVSEFSKYGDKHEDAIGFYVVQADGTLGERIESEEEASVIRYNSLSQKISAIRLVSHRVAMLIAVLSFALAATAGYVVHIRKRWSRYYIASVALLVVTGIYFLTAGRPRAEVEISIEEFREMLRSAPDVGDTAVPITALTTESNERVEVVFDGRVTWIEFWATWCGPCQQSMKELNDIAQDGFEKWGEEVQLVTISVDEDLELARGHLKTNDWLHTRNLIDDVDSDSTSDIARFKGSAARDYVITGVPTALLIDRRGTIVHRGNPNSLDLVAEIEELLAK